MTGSDIKPPKDAAAFERRVVDLWARTRLPLTRANLMATTGAPRAKLDGWLDAMVKDGLLELDSDDEGELLWTVRGAKRAPTGLASLDQVLRMNALGREADAEVSQRGLAVRARGDAVVADKKSVLASGLLSFLFGPFGLLYAAPLKVALPAVGAWVLACAIIPTFILIYVMGALSPIFAVAGVLYALGYNLAGERVTIFGRDEDGKPRPKLFGR
jgi:hypothetical protein